MKLGYDIEVIVHINMTEMRYGINNNSILQ